MTSKPLIPSGGGPLAAMRGVQDALGIVDDMDGWERQPSEKELETIHREIEYLTPVAKTLDGSLLIKRNSKESEVLKGRITAARTISSTSLKKTDK